MIPPRHEYWFDVEPLRPPARLSGYETSESTEPSRPLGGAATGTSRADRLKARARLAAERAKEAVTEKLTETFSRSADPGPVIAAFAAANGLTYRATVTNAGADQPGIHLDDDMDHVVATLGGPESAAGSVTPYVEFGNHMSRGYIAVRHDLLLPHVVVHSRFAGKKANALATAAVLGWVALDTVAADRSSDESPTKSGRFMKVATKLKDYPPKTILPDGSGKPRRPFSVYIAKPDLAAGIALVKGPAVSALYEFARSFHLEFREGWLIAYNQYGEVSTTDPDTWAWIFSTASRMLDLLDLLATTTPVRPGVDPTPWR